MQEIRQRRQVRRHHQIDNLLRCKGIGKSICPNSNPQQKKHWDVAQRTQEGLSEYDSNALCMVDALDNVINLIFRLSVRYSEYCTLVCLTKSAPLELELHRLR